MNTKYTKELLEPIVKESNSLTEVLKKLNLREAGGNFKTIKKYIELYNIDYDHILNKKHPKIYKEKQPIELFLTENSKLNRGSLKKRLYDEGYKTRICEICGLGEIWQNKKMTLILDHINGVYNDNRLCNLRIVCPNCNATLDTHCGKNTSKRNKKLLEMGIDINQKTDLRKLPLKDKIEKTGLGRNEHLRKTERPPYSELISHIKEKGYLSTGKYFGVSDNAIRKWVMYYEKQL
jgi:hypothetical protein